MTEQQIIVKTIEAAGKPVAWRELKDAIAASGLRRPGHKRFLVVIREMEGRGILRRAQWLGGGTGAWCSDIPRQPEVPCNCPNQLLDRSCCAERLTEVLLSDVVVAGSMDWSATALQYRPRPGWVVLGLKGAGVVSRGLGQKSLTQDKIDSWGED